MTQREQLAVIATLSEKGVTLRLLEEVNLLEGETLELEYTSYGTLNVYRVKVENP